MFRRNICSIFAIVLAAANVAAASPAMSAGAQEISDVEYAYEETQTDALQEETDGTDTEYTETDSAEAADAAAKETVENTEPSAVSEETAGDAGSEAAAVEDSIEGASVEDYEAGAHWEKSGGTWYYYGANGSKLTGWQKIGGRWYYLNPSDGAMLYGWRYLSWSGGKNWFYFGSSSDGAMKTGWQYLNWSGGKNWFYFDGSGAMKTGWQKLSWGGGSSWFYFNGSGAMRTSWQYLSWSGGKNWFYFDGSGAMKTGWLDVNGKRYYLNPSSGAMVTGTNTIDGVTYTMDSSGALTGNSASESKETSSTSQIDMSALKSELQSMAKSAGGTWAIYVKDLSTGQTLDINATKSMMSASIIKIFIAGAYYDAVANGKVSGNYDSTVRSMIVYSDNSATNKLIDLVGMSNINSFISKQGFSGSTKLNRKMLQSGRENYVSMKDCGDVLERIYNRTYVNAGASDKIWSYLKDQDSRNKIPAGITDSGATIGNKTGEIAGNSQGAYVIGDVALVYGSKADMVICIVENGKYSNTVISTISKMAGTIYSTCNK